ncbi:Carboxylesterase [Sporormia fimetaria CBS 119925]|uniref:Carboxylic ester hydrolase n=1 Tax=Sporormia fimetaria CBS 119925 TaxID=1340428 RepID=A0A6A6VLY8_9PLEO|nr:Carboxylesterase [Sporormia fimetaria CBS 119925]
MLLSVLLLGVTALTPFVGAQAPTVTAENGVFVGSQTAIPGAPQGVKKFLGIPFAVTPPQRFSAPVKAPASRQVRQATNYGPGCPQIVSGNIPGRIKPLPVTPPPDSEDCLYANVYVPAGRAPLGGYPVMFWIYGGGFQFGGSSNPAYDGSYLAANHSVVVVTINYRLNLFGFLGSVPGVKVAELNPGLLDQRLALDWTRANIAKFGGDPDKITIFGESAGAVSVDLLYLTASPLRPPFRGAILQSGGYGLIGDGGALTTPNTTISSAQRLAQAVSCPWDASTLACLRSKSVSELTTASTSIRGSWTPVQDGGVTVPETTGNRIRRLGRGARVPVLMGSNANEAILFTLPTPTLTFTQLFAAVYPELAPYEAEIRAAYPVGGCSVTGCWPSELLAVSQAIGDYIFVCPAARSASASAKSLVNTYRYLYNRTEPTLPPPLNRAAFHAAEVPLVFGTQDGSGGPTQAAVSQFMMKTWTDFAKNPESPGIRRYTGVSLLKEILQIGGPANPLGGSQVDITVVDAYCRIFDKVYDQTDPAR